MGMIVDAFWRKMDEYTMKLLWDDSSDRALNDEAKRVYYSIRVNMAIRNEEWFIRNGVPRRDVIRKKNLRHMSTSCLEGDFYNELIMAESVNGSYKGFFGPNSKVGAPGDMPLCDFMEKNGYRLDSKLLNLPTGSRADLMKSYIRKVYRGKIESFFILNGDEAPEKDTRDISNSAINPAFVYVKEKRLS